jgi:hypothetical protein
MNKDKKKVVKELDDLLTGNTKDISMKPRHEALQLPIKQFVRISAYQLKGILHSLLSDNDIFNPMHSLLFIKEYRNPNLFKDIQCS